MITIYVNGFVQKTYASIRYWRYVGLNLYSGGAIGKDVITGMITSASGLPTKHISLSDHNSGTCNTSNGSKGKLLDYHNILHKYLLTIDRKIIQWY